MHTRYIHSRQIKKREKKKKKKKMEMLQVSKGANDQEKT